MGHASLVTRSNARQEVGGRDRPRAPVCLHAEVRPVPGWPVSVSAAGEVYGPHGLRKPSLDRRHGYLYVTVRLPGRARPVKLRVHRAVLLAWVGPCPPGMEGRHANGDQLDNRLTNLSWSTHVENIADKDRHGTMARGAGVGTAKLTEADVREMRRLRPGSTVAELGRRFGVGKSTAQDVVRGRTWRHLS